MLLEAHFDMQQGKYQCNAKEIRSGALRIDSFRFKSLEMNYVLGGHRETLIYERSEPNLKILISSS